MGNSNSSYKRVLVPFTEEELVCIFKNHDRDRDGKLSKAELKKAFNYLGSRCSAFRAEEAIRNADVNGDGAIGFDELNNLVQYTMRRRYTLG